MKRVLLLTALLPVMAIGAEIQHSFNSPAFSGVGYSSHVLTIKQLEDNQKEKNKSAAEAALAKEAADRANTPQARFLANLESRVYAQLAKQLTDSLFGDGSTTPQCNAASAGSVCGMIPDLAGNRVEWKLGTGSDNGMIIVTITNISNPSQTTEMKVPSGSFYF